MVGQVNESCDVTKGRLDLIFGNRNAIAQNTDDNNVEMV